MLRLPSVSGRFYPSDPAELKNAVRSHLQIDDPQPPIRARACLVPHAGYIYSGHVAGAAFARISLPAKIVILGVRHYPRGERAAILSSGAWRTPLGDVQVSPVHPLSVKAAYHLAYANQFSLVVQTMRTGSTVRKESKLREVPMHTLQTKQIEV